MYYFRFELVAFLSLVLSLDSIINHKCCFFLFEVNFNTFRLVVNYCNVNFRTNSSSYLGIYVYL